MSDLVGLFGHELHPGDGEYAGLAKCQFEITRKHDDGYEVQMFSALSGYPTNVQFYAEPYLTDPDRCRLYRNADEWRRKYEEACSIISMRMKVAAA